MKSRLPKPFTSPGGSIPPGVLVGVSAYALTYLIWMAIGVGDRELISDLAFLPIIGAAALASWRAGERAGTNDQCPFNWMEVGVAERVAHCRAWEPICHKDPQAALPLTSPMGLGLPKG